MKKNFIGIGGGLLTVISMFLPVFSIAGMTSNGLELGGVAYFFMICGAIIALISYTSKRWINITSIILGLLIAMLALKYQADTTDMEGEIGIGLWVLLIGGLASIVGGIYGILKNKNSAASA